ncbi:ORF6N domain-containing protein [Saccharicrinis sp. FJH62]|uniref:ORF6N domain-containing protein n=1 Tax=Saccharicrinis sp. FJH62 TaxID=3344657 RepID=UPI0035D4841B
MSNIIIPLETIATKILLLRDEKVILDIHLSDLYDVETRVLKQAVRRNIERFPLDFMFELEDDEIELLVSQNVIPSKKILGGARPFAFTETGVAMLSSVLKNKKAIDINIAIMRTFIKLRKALNDNTKLMRRLDDIEYKSADHNKKIMLIFEYLKQFEEAKQKEINISKRKRIGFKTYDSQEE